MSPAAVPYLPAHINQFHRVKADGSDGPPWGRSWGVDYNSKNCWAAVGAMAADFASRGAWKPTPPEFRTLSGDKVGGAFPSDIARVLKAQGYTAQAPTEGVSWPELDRLRATGRWFIAVATVYGDIPDAKSCQPRFDGWHMLGLPPLPQDGQGRTPAHDPLCNRMRWYDPVVLRQSARHCANQLNSHGLVVCLVRQIPAPDPVPPVDPRDLEILRLERELEAAEDERDELARRNAAAVDVLTGSETDTPTDPPSDGIDP